MSDSVASKLTYLFLADCRCDGGQVSPDLLPVALLFFFGESGVGCCNQSLPSLNEISRNHKSAVSARKTLTVNITLPMSPSLVFKRGEGLH